MQRFSTLTLLLAIFLAGCSSASSAPTVAPVELTVAAAADLQFAFTEIGELYEQETGNNVIFSFGSTGQLAQQIENGAPFDLFAAANISFVDDLAKKNLVLPNTVALYARGRIVLAVNRDSVVKAVTLEDLLSDTITHIAIANPEHAPYGVAAKEALISAGVWEKVEDKIVLGENVRQTLQFVQTGDAQVGIVALSVANVPEVTWTLIDDSLHSPLDQALAVVASTSYQEEAKEFAAFINGEKGRPIMQKYGFVLPGETISALTPYMRYSPFVLSLWVSSWAGIIALFLGTIIAWALVKVKFKGKWIAEGLIMSPLILPPTLVGYYLLTFLGQRGIGAWVEQTFGFRIVFSIQGAVIAAAVTALPLVVQTVQVSIAAIAREIEEAARMDGCTRWDIFWHIDLPLIWRGLLAGGVLGFLRAMGDFGTTLMVAGNIPFKTQTMSMAIYDAAQANNLPLANQLALILSSIGFGLIFVVVRLRQSADD